MSERLSVPWSETVVPEYGGLCCGGLAAMDGNCNGERDGWKDHAGVSDVGVRVR